MGAIQLFHATLDGLRELEEKPFRLEKELQGFIEKHLSDLFGMDLLDTEHSTGPHDKQRIDTLGIDRKGRPVVIEYKLRGDRNIINQGLGYLDWLRKNPDSIELLVIKKFGPVRARGLDLKHPRLLCIAGAFTQNDEIAAEKCMESVELVRYCRCGDSTFIVEWVYGDSAHTESQQKKAAAPKKVQKTAAKAAAIRPAKRPDFSTYEYWEKTVQNAPLHRLFMALHDHLISLGEDVRPNPTKKYISFVRKQTIAYVKLQTGKNRLIVYIRVVPEHTPPQKGFLREKPPGIHFSRCNVEITIRNDADLEKAKPLLRQSYQLSG